MIIIMIINNGMIFTVNLYSDECPDIYFLLYSLKQSLTVTNLHMELRAGGSISLPWARTRAGLAATTITSSQHMLSE